MRETREWTEAYVQNKSLDWMATVPPTGKDSGKNTLIWLLLFAHHNNQVHACTDMTMARPCPQTHHRLKGCITPVTESSRRPRDVRTCKRRVGTAKCNQEGEWQGKHERVGVITGKMRLACIRCDEGVCMCRGATHSPPLSCPEVVLTVPCIMLMAGVRQPPPPRSRVPRWCCLCPASR